MQYVPTENRTESGGVRHECFALTYERAGRGMWRVTRGGLEPIGTVRKDCNTGLWAAYDTEGVRADGRGNDGSGWTVRYVAAEEMSVRTPLPPDGWVDQFAV